MNTDDDGTSFICGFCDPSIRGILGGIAETMVKEKPQCSSSSKINKIPPTKNKGKTESKPEASSKPQDEISQRPK